MSKELTDEELLEAFEKWNIKGIQFSRIGKLARTGLGCPIAREAKLVFKPMSEYKEGEFGCFLVPLSTGYWDTVVGYIDEQGDLAHNDSGDNLGWEEEDPMYFCLLPVLPEIEKGKPGFPKTKFTPPSSRERNCPDCDGTGKLPVDLSECPCCGGSGKDVSTPIENGREAELVKLGAEEVLKDWAKDAYPKPSNFPSNLKLMAERYALKALSGKGSK